MTRQSPQWLEQYHRVVQDFLQKVATVELTHKNPIFTKIRIGTEAALLEDGCEHQLLVPLEFTTVEIARSSMAAGFPTEHFKFSESVVLELEDLSKPTPQLCWAATLRNFGQRWDLVTKFEKGLCAQQFAREENTIAITITNGLNTHTLILPWEKAADNGVPKNLAPLIQNQKLPHHYLAAHRT